MTTHRLYALACAALLTISLVAKSADAPTRTADILAQQQTIRADMKAKRDRYANIPRDAQKSVLSDQEKLEKLLEGKVDTSQLAPPDQAEVRRLMARIEATVKNNQDERPVCTQEARTGSNYVTRVCHTPTEIRSRKEADEKLLKDENSRIKCTDANGCV
jgi:predicted exporter